MEWLIKHPEINNIQGWEIERENWEVELTNGKKQSHSRIVKFGNHWADMEFLMTERRALNDWIRSYNKKNGA